MTKVYKGSDTIKILYAVGRNQAVIKNQARIQVGYGFYICVMYYWNQTIHICVTIINKFRNQQWKLFKSQFDFKLFKCFRSLCQTLWKYRSSKFKGQSQKKKILNQPLNLNTEVWGTLHWAYISNSWHVTFPLEYV